MSAISKIPSNVYNEILSLKYFKHNVSEKSITKALNYMASQDKISNYVDIDLKEGSITFEVDGNKFKSHKGKIVAL